MLTIKIDDATKLKVYFNYQHVGTEQKQEIKGKNRFRRRLTEAVLELWQHDEMHATKIVGSAINDSTERFDRVHGREAALRNITDNIVEDVAMANWPTTLSTEEHDLGDVSNLSTTIWDAYRKQCTRRIYPQYTNKPRKNKRIADKH